MFDAVHAAFPFVLAADWHRGICRAYGVLDEKSQVARRVLILCDHAAVVRHVVDDYEPEQLDRFEGLMDMARQIAAPAANAAATQPWLRQ